jgi:hypothetical protein
MFHDRQTVVKHTFVILRTSSQLILHTGPTDLLPTVLLFCIRIPQNIAINKWHIVAITIYLIIASIKDKAVPLQAWSGPEGSRKLR